VSCFAADGQGFLLLSHLGILQLSSALSSLSLSLSILLAFSPPFTVYPIAEKKKKKP
jgi:hypothetical protein